MRKLYFALILWSAFYADSGNPSSCTVTVSPLMEVVVGLELLDFTWNMDYGDPPAGVDPPTLLRGDMDGDGHINSTDAEILFSILLEAFNFQQTEERADLNDDGFLDNLDGVLFMNLFHQAAIISPQVGLVTGGTHQADTAPFSAPTTFALTSLNAGNGEAVCTTQEVTFLPLVATPVEIDANTPNGPPITDDDRFGQSIADLGFLDGDGARDMAVGAVLDHGNGFRRGAVHILFLDTNGAPLSTVEINDSTPNGPVLNDEDFFGIALANLGNLDGDGVRDLAVGAPGDNGGDFNTGAVHVLFLNTDGLPKSTFEINDSTPNGPVLAVGDIFGRSVANLGDLDGDGVQDIAVGAAGDDEGGVNRGAVHILFLDTDGSPRSTVEINGSTPNSPNLSDEDQFGVALASLGDLDGDGVQDLVVGAIDDQGGFNTGAVHILFLSPGGMPLRTVEINVSTPNGPVISAGDVFGFSIANLGDLDLDGVPDIAVGAPGDDAGGISRGTVHILFLNLDGSPKRAIEINHGTLNGPVLSDGDLFGTSLANLDDLDFNGVQDLAVGTREDGGGVDRGSVHILFFNQ